jgi:hypothetical protein
MMILGGMVGNVVVEGFFYLLFCFLAKLAQEFHPEKRLPRLLLLFLDLLTTLWFFSPSIALLAALLTQEGLYAGLALILFLSYLACFVLACQSTRSYFRSLYLPYASLRR